MAARPNARRTLEYGQRLALNHADRLNEMITMCERVVQENKLLTPDEITAYKECRKVGQKQLVLFQKLAEIAVPEVDTATKRGRGRPSKSELSELEAMRSGKPVATAASGSKKVSKKKASKEASTDTIKTAAATPAKKRGRPPKSTVETAVATSTPVAPKRRGRPPKSVSAAAGDVGAPVKRGRPKGSKNKTKVMNGHNHTSAESATTDVSETT